MPIVRSFCFQVLLYKKEGKLFNFTVIEKPAIQEWDFDELDPIEVDNMTLN